MLNDYIGKIINADCQNVLSEIPDNSVNLILTDPPYLLTPHGGGKQGLADRSSKIRDEIEFIANDFDFEPIFNEFIRICKVPNMIIFCSALQLGRTITFFESKGLRADVLVWSKSNPAPLSNGKYISDIEYIVYVHTKGSAWNGSAPLAYKKKTKVYPIITNKDKNKIHPTQKPIELIMELICVHSFEGDIVLDCFSGSGTTAVVCHSLNREFICVEKDFEFWKASVKRLEDHKKQLTLF